MQLTIQFKPYHKPSTSANTAGGSKRPLIYLFRYWLNIGLVWPRQCAVIQTIKNWYGKRFTGFHHKNKWGKKETTCKDNRKNIWKMSLLRTTFGWETVRKSCTGCIPWHLLTFKLLKYLMTLDWRLTLKGNTSNVFSVFKKKVTVSFVWA